MPEVESTLVQLKYALEFENIESFMNSLRNLFASIPYNLHINCEFYYHSLVKLLCNLRSFENHCETAMSTGKIDLVIIRQKYIYCIEFKFNKSAKEALEQIISHRYYEPYISMGKEIVLIGISFNFKNKELMLDWSTQIR